MNTLVLKALSLVPWFKLAKWLLAETGWQRDVAEWLAAENEWYFRLAAKAWGNLDTNDDADIEELKRRLREMEEKK
jgi:hypothetical protein